MFTVKVREERVPENNLGPVEISEVLYSAKQVMRQGLKVIIDPVDGGQITYDIMRDAPRGYSGKIYVMNEAGATVAAYELADA